MLCAVALAACGGGSGARPGTDAGLDSPGQPDASPDAGPDAPVPPDAPTCLPPCFATGMSFLTATSMMFHDGTLYVTDSDTQVGGDPNHRVGSIHAIAADGRVTTLATAQPSPHSLVVDAGTLYWSNGGWVDVTDGSRLTDAGIQKLPAGATAPVAVLAPFPRFVPAAVSIAIDSGTIYFDNLESAFTVFRVSVDGGNPEVVAQDDLQPGHVRVQPVGLSQHGDHLYWVDQLGGVASVAKTGGTVTTLVPPLVQTGAVGVGVGTAIDDQSFYYVVKGDGADDMLFAVPLQGGAATPLVQQRGLDAPLVRDGDNLYFRLLEDIYRVPVAGGTPVKVASPKYAGGEFAVDATYVYWGEDGKVLRQPK